MQEVTYSNYILKSMFTLIAKSDFFILLDVDTSTSENLLLKQIESHNETMNWNHF